MNSSNDPIKAVIALHARTTRGKRRPGRQQPFNVYETYNGRVVLKGEDAIPGHSEREVIANAHHAALMYNVTLPLLELLNVVNAAVSEAQTNPAVVAALLPIAVAFGQLTESISKEMEAQQTALIRVKGFDGDYAVHAYVDGAFAVHETVHAPACWTVTHIPTGCAVVKCLHDYEAAISLRVELLALDVDWESLTGTQDGSGRFHIDWQNIEPLRAKMREIVERYEGPR